MSWLITPPGAKLGLLSLGNMCLQEYFYIQGVSKKMSFLGKIAITTFKLIQNAKAGGVLENSEYLLPDGHWDFRNWKRNDGENKAWSCQPPLQKSAEFTAHIMHSFDDPLHFHDLQWNQNLFHTLVEGKVKVVLHPWPDVSSSRTITPSRMAERINQCILWAVNSVDFFRGGW